MKYKVPWEERRFGDLRVGEWFTGGPNFPVFRVAKSGISDGRVEIDWVCIEEGELAPLFKCGDVGSNDYDEWTLTRAWDANPVSKEETDRAKRRLRELQ